ncbi:hypothetical protein [Spiribacter roseus]|uniref:hypothetical protein n=1 Tax=Spiribacter roseus TaxID=1855875 RepID=UPI0012FD33B2
MSNEILTTKVQETLNELQSKHAEWDKQQRYADTLLYTLLEGCLDFYYFLRKDERFESAFKGMCGFKWNSSTTLASLITKSVFGAKAKKGYAYAKALIAAVDNGVGVSGAVGMAQWLKENGGVNGVIRDKAADAAAKAERDYKVWVGKNYERFGVRSKFEPIDAPQIVEMIDDEEFLLLVQRDTQTGKLIPKWYTDAEALREGIYIERGEALMEQSVYFEKRAEVIAELEREEDEATEKVLEALTAVKSKLAQAEDEEALAA